MEISLEWSLKKIMATCLKLVSEYVDDFVTVLGGSLV